MRGVHILVLLIISCCAAKELPSFIKKCRRADPVPELSKCMKERASFLKPYLLKGIPELKLPPIEPLYIPKMEIQSGSTSAFGFKASFANITVYGVKDFQVEELRFDLEKREAFLHLRIPTLLIQSIYSINGKLLLFELASTGRGYTNITDVESKSLTSIVMETRNGKEYAIIQEDPTSYIDYGTGSIYLADLFPNNQELTEQTNKALNDNLEEVAREVNPLIYESIRQLVLGIIGPVFSEYSLDELFD